MGSKELENLERLGLLEAAPFSAQLQARLIQTARNRLADALRAENSLETRFDCAYTAVRALADVVLFASGYRTSTSKPGHHQTTLQCLSHTLNLEPASLRLLDSLRKQRNASDYDGEPLTETALQECIAQAKRLISLVCERYGLAQDANPTNGS